MKHCLDIHIIYSAPFLNLQTHQGPMWFLLDTGIPKLGFAFSPNLEIPAGPRGLFPTQSCRLDPPFIPSSALTKLRQLTGLPVMGMIGAGYLRSWGSALIDYERSQLVLGDQLPTAEGDELLEMPSPFGVNAHIKDEHGRFHIDTGSLFNISLGAPSPISRYVHVPSFHGELRFGLFQAPITVLTISGRKIETRRSVTCDAPHPVQILGSEWLSSFGAVGFGFREQRLLLRPKAPHAERAANPGSFEYGPPFVQLLNPEELSQEGRSFKLEALPDTPLPEGLSPEVNYQLKGQPIPSGPEGANALFKALYRDEPGEVTLVHEGLERVVPLRPLWTTA